jgi:maltoporin
MYGPSHLRQAPWITTLVAAGVLTCAAQQSPSQQPAAQQPAAQQPTDLQKQLDELKQQYEQTSRELQQRIAALEQQIAKQKEAAEKSKEGTISSVELAAQQAAQKAVLGESDQVGAKYQGQLPSEPTYDLLREADQKIEQLNEQV